MTTADYRCDKCQRLIELPVDTSGMRCGHDGCKGKLCRVWTPIAIGKVQGAGGSPARGSSLTTQPERTPT